MNVLILGQATVSQYVENLKLYFQENDVLYTFQSHFCQNMDLAAEQLNMKLFLTDFFLAKGEQRHMDKIIYFTNFINLTEVMVLEEAMNFKKHIIFIPI